LAASSLQLGYALQHARHLYCRPLAGPASGRDAALLGKKNARNPQRWLLSSNSLGPNVVNDFASDHGQERLDVLNLVCGYCEIVLVKYQ
jgi:hypothetical protein